MLPITTSHHRNGITSAPFYVGIVEEEVNGEKKNLFIVQFDEDRTAVFDFDLLKKANIAFGENSWRGDYFAEAFAKVVGTND